jgi:dTDP-4-dehydrorhamnose 3,5-epimerase-like enzyme
VAQRLIEGVKVKQLRVVADERGRLMEMLRRDDPCFVEVGQTYLTTMYPGVVPYQHDAPDERRIDPHQNHPVQLGQEGRLT